MEKIVIKSFLMGFFAHAFTSMFFQDWYGLEKYIQLARLHWMDIHWAWWLPLLFGCFYSLARYRIIAKRIDELKVNY